MNKKWTKNEQKMNKQHHNKIKKKWTKNEQMNTQKMNKWTLFNDVYFCSLVFNEHKMNNYSNEQMNIHWTN